MADAPVVDRRQHTTYARPAEYRKAAAGYVLPEIGCTSEAREHGDRARALDPLYWPAPVGSCVADLMEVNFGSALEKMVRMHTISGGDPAANGWLGVCLVYAGRSDEAARWFAGPAAAASPALAGTPDAGYHT